MIAHLQGQILFSDGLEIILLTNSGVGYQIYYPRVLREGSSHSIFISHVIKEASEDLYGFDTLREKKLFETLLSVKGVGPKSAFTLIKALGFDTICESITLESKKSLSKAPGVGPKAAAQIILDLSTKIHKVKMYSPNYQVSMEFKDEPRSDQSVGEIYIETKSGTNEVLLLDEALMACKELGFSEEKIIPIAQKVLAGHEVSKAEQLVHLVLKEI